MQQRSLRTAEEIRKVSNALEPRRR
jgi:hypothetical protein